MNAPHQRPGDAVAAARARGPVAIAVAAVLAASLVACGSATTSPPASGPAGTTAASPAPVATPAPTVTPAAYADTLRIGWPPEQAIGFRGLALADASPSIAFAQLVYGSLYRYDARYSAIPDLADGPCFVPGADARVIRCRIVATTFHDGTPLTANDVAYAYRLFSLPDWCGMWVPCTLEEVRVVDPRTVDFTLSTVDPTFLTDGVTGVPIFSRREVEARYAAFADAAKGLTADGVQQLVDTIKQETVADPAVCSDQRLAEVDALLARLGGHLYREDYQQPNGTFDPCAYLWGAADRLQYVAWTLQASGLGAVIQSLVFWSSFQPPAGTGPYRLVSEDAGRVHLEAFAGYHGGLAATRYVDFVPAKGGGSDVEAGTIDVSQAASLDSAYLVSAPAHGVQVGTAPTPGYYALTLNVRPGHLFADVNLRRALQLCIDLPRDVDAATGGTGTPVYGPVAVGSWADNPNLPKPTRDVAAAKRLIEGSGWQLGSEGIYVSGERRLAADILVRKNMSDRVRMVDLIAKQARDCGMDLRSRPMDFWTQLSPMIHQYPHDIPGTKTPFDIYLLGWIDAPEPAGSLARYLSSAVTDETHPDWVSNPNVGGFIDLAYDRLIAAGAATYDQAERARVYRQAQQELASQQPVIFLWAANSSDAVRAAVTTTSGPLDLSVPNWAWQPQRLVVAASP